MNAQERFRAITHFEPCDRALLWEFGYWAGTVQRWYAEGLPSKTHVASELGFGETVCGEGIMNPFFPRDEDVHKLLDMDEPGLGLSVNFLFCPPFAAEVLEDEGETLLVRDVQGRTLRRRKDNATIPKVLGWAVSNRDDWERLKAERLTGRFEKRVPVNWQELVEGYKHRSYPIALGGDMGFFSTPRDLMGLEQLLVAYYDQPDLLLDMMDFLSDLWIQLYDRVLQDVDADYAIVWEDMCFKNGPLVSPAIFERFIAPGYKKLTGFLRDRGIDTIIVDTDGNCWKLLPLFVECGVTGLYPFEVQAGMDIVEVRKAFPRLQIFGGLDKRVLAQGKDAIDRELRDPLSFMLRSGSYVPYADHLIPPDVPWENFAYYRQLVRSLSEGAGMAQ